MKPSPAPLSTLLPVACNMAEALLSPQAGGVGYSKHLAARRSRLVYRIRCRGSSGEPRLAIASEAAKVRSETTFLLLCALSAHSELSGSPA